MQFVLYIIYSLAIKCKFVVLLYSGFYIVMVKTKSAEAKKQ